MKAQRDLLAPQPTTFGQIAAAVLGLVLVVVGLLGLTVNTSFDTGSSLDSDTFAGFAVNGWDLVILTAAVGLLLAISALRASWARRALRFTGLVYLVMFFAGLGSDDAFGWVPANTADDILRAVLAVFCFWAAAVSKEKRDIISRDRVVVAEDEEPARVVGPGTGHVGGPRSVTPRIDRRLPLKKHP